MAIATAGVIGGTFLGRAMLGWLDERLLRRVVALLIIALGIWLLVSAQAGEAAVSSKPT